MNPGKKQRFNRKATFENCIVQLYASYKRKCRTKDIFFGISLEFFKSLIIRDCFYCGAPPRNGFVRTYYTFLYQGIDRKDNGRGYEDLNCVACCLVCNSIKGNNLSHQEMIVVAHALKGYRTLIKLGLERKTQDSLAP